MNEWHVDPTDLAAFRDGALSAVAATSAEAHLVACARCRLVLATIGGASSADADRRARVWAGVADRIDRPSHDWGGHWWLKATVGTPALCSAAVALLVALLVVPVAAAAGSTRAATAVLYALAPLAPVLGAVLAYRSDADPAGEIVCATPLASARLVLARAAVVLAVAIPVGLCASALLPLPLRLVVGWLVPGVALCAVVLACASRIEPSRLASALALAWSLAVGAALARTRTLPIEVALDRIFVNQVATQVVFGVVAIVAAFVVGARRADLRLWSSS